LAKLTAETPGTLITATLQGQTGEGKRGAPLEGTPMALVIAVETTTITVGMVEAIVETTAGTTTEIPQVVVDPMETANDPAHSVMKSGLA
jgi:hypothetical protein